MSEALRALPIRMPPAGLTTSLRVIASRERQRRAASSGFRGLLGRWELFAKNLMRPLALPLAGGVFSAVGLFSLLIPTYPMRVDNRFDVPTMLTTQVSG